MAILRGKPKWRGYKLKRRLASNASDPDRAKYNLDHNCQPNFSKKFWYMKKISPVTGGLFFHMFPSNRYRRRFHDEVEKREHRRQKWWWHGLYKVGKGGIQRKYEAQGRFLPARRKRSIVGKWKNIVAYPRNAFKVNTTRHYP